jgi:uncharacterized membrane protein
LLYWVCISLHLLAASIWLGHMFVWSLIVGPAIKRVEPPATAEFLRARSLFLGGLGWPALVVLIVTGLYLLSVRGISPVDLVTGAAHAAAGWALTLKLVLVLFMIVYQAVWGHREAGVAIYLDMLAALVVLAASVVLVRGLAG